MCERCGGPVGQVAVNARFLSGAPVRLCLECGADWYAPGLFEASDAFVPYVEGVIGQVRDEEQRELLEV